jgi:hypothetical protein
MLLEVAMNQLIEKFDKISLYNNVTNFECLSASNSNSTTNRVEPRKLAPEPSCRPVLPNKQFSYGLRSANKIYADALTSRWAGNEIVSKYSLDSNVVLDYNSDSSNKFDFESDPIEPEPDYSLGPY